MSGQALLPGAVMFEAAAAALAHLSAAASPASHRPALAALSIAAPLALSPRGGALLELSINPEAGTLAAYSMNLVSADRQLHLRTTAVQCRLADGNAAVTRSAGAANASAAAVAGSSVTEIMSRKRSWAAIVLQDAVAEMGRFAGGTLANLDSRQDQPGSG